MTPTLAVLDDRQRELLAALDRIGESLRVVSEGEATLEGNSAPMGLYVYGPVGRGKSWVVGQWFQRLIGEPRLRVHFHAFLEQLHRAVFMHRQSATPGVSDPIRAALGSVLGQSRVVFIDEFHVHDPGDAVLLTRLLEYLCEHNILLLATSNYAPQDLGPGSESRHVFAAGITMILGRLEIFELDGPTDYRSLRAPVQDQMAAGFASGRWELECGHENGRASPVPLRARDRSFEVVRVTENELHATFTQLCEQPLSTIEYLVWARQFERWVLGAVPAGSEVELQAMQRFVHLIDVLVDADVQLTVRAAQPLDEFMRQAPMVPDKARLQSRLSLMK